MPRLPLAPAAILLAVSLTAGLWLDRDLNPERHALRPDGGPRVEVMNFTESFPLDSLAPGWRHRLFMTRPPMTLSLTTKAGRQALRAETHDSASMLFRMVDIPLDQYRFLNWGWLVEKGIESTVSELTRAGDDHPARLYVSFIAPDGTPHSMEVIWANQLLEPGEYKYIGGFPHYVANAGRANWGQWWDEEIDLRAIYDEIWGPTSGVHVTSIAVFCDSDETGGRTTAYFDRVGLSRQPGGQSGDDTTPIL